jgi:hypothetical protein
VLSCLDARDGRPLIENVRLAGLRTVYASPVAAREYIYFTDRDGRTAVLRASGDDLEMVAQNELGEGVDASPALAGTQLFLRGREHLFCLEEAEEDGAAAASPPPERRD